MWQNSTRKIDKDEKIKQKRFKYKWQDLEIADDFGNAMLVKQFEMMFP